MFVDLDRAPGVVADAVVAFVRELMNSGVVVVCERLGRFCTMDSSRLPVACLASHRRRARTPRKSEVRCHLALAKRFLLGPVVVVKCRYRKLARDTTQLPASGWREPRRRTDARTEAVEAMYGPVLCGAMLRTWRGKSASPTFTLYQAREATRSSPLRAGPNSECRVGFETTICSSALSRE